MAREATRRTTADVRSALVVNDASGAWLREHRIALAQRAICEPAPPLVPGDPLPRGTPKRRLELAWGRAAARAALSSLDARLEDSPVPMGVAGEPMFPPGVVGSIAHAHGFVVGVAAPTRAVVALGVDLASTAALPPRASRRVVHHEDWLPAARSDVASDALVFAAKEALYKAWWPLAKRPLGFGEVALRVGRAPLEFGFVPRGTLATDALATRILEAAEGRWILDLQGASRLFVALVAVAKP
jgi:4'-phosphopantetheinyl transferase EntD